MFVCSNSVMLFSCHILWDLSARSIWNPLTSNRIFRWKRKVLLACYFITDNYKTRFYNARHIIAKLFRYHRQKYAVIKRFIAGIKNCQFDHFIKRTAVLEYCMNLQPFQIITIESTWSLNPDINSIFMEEIIQPLQLPKWQTVQCQ